MYVVSQKECVCLCVCTYLSLSMELLLSLSLMIDSSSSRDVDSLVNFSKTCNASNDKGAAAYEPDNVLPWQQGQSHICNLFLTDQPLAEPVAVVVLQASSKVVRQLTGFDVAGQLVGRHQDHLAGSKDSSS